ncbi:MAG TPA: TIGR02206 family membrane protein, partial [Brachybacterium paraconglomeratum]|nr:TIGR02206 family membrane protein [Brachybacterium paraconglomeratum]
LLAAPAIGHMPAYGAAHLALLALLVLAAIVLVRWARRTEPAATDRALRLAGWALLANSAAWTAWGFMPWAWNLEESLPLHYSDALRFLVPIALITQARWAVVVTWFWGLTLNMQSVLTPDLNYFVWVPLEFAEYWIAHGAGVLAPVVLVWGLGYRPTWRGYGIAYAATLLWAGIAVTGNTLTGANYGYLNRAPAGPSILDLLGPWPQYLLVEAVLIAAVWAAMTLPWVLIDRRAGTPLSGRGGLVRRSVPAQASSSSSASRSGPSEVVTTRR